MEYLMTYGWAILIIAIVLGAMYSLGIFNSIGYSSSACLSSPGYLCTNLQYSTNIAHKCGYAGVTGYPSITATVGTIQGPLTNVWFVVAPINTTINDTIQTDNTNPNDFFYWASNVGSYAKYPIIAAGQQQPVNICVDYNLPSGQIGQTLQGQIWMMYTTPSTANALAVVGKFNVASTS